MKLGKDLINRADGVVEHGGEGLSGRALDWRIWKINTTKKQIHKRKQHVGGVPSVMHEGQPRATERARAFFRA